MYSFFRWREFGVAETKKHNIRIPRWEEAEKKAEGLRIPVARVVNQAIDDFLAEARVDSANRLHSPVAEKLREEYEKATGKRYVYGRSTRKSRATSND